MAPRAAAVARTGAADPAGAEGWAAASFPWRSVIEFRNFTEAISKLSISEVVLDSRNICASSSVIATAKPEAVLFIATDMAAANKLAFSAGFAVATALNAPIRPVMVPSKPMSSPTFANEDR